jgi:hypothetical protein
VSGSVRDHVIFVGQPWHLRSHDRHHRRHRAWGARYVESVIPPGNAFSSREAPHSRDALPSAGVERTEAEYRELIRVSGFRLERVLATRWPAHIIEGVEV